MRSLQAEMIAIFSQILKGKSLARWLGANAELVL